MKTAKTIAHTTQTPPNVYPANLASRLNFSTTIVDFLGATHLSYNARGNKLAQEAPGSLRRDYLSGIELADGAPESIYHPEGRALREGGQWKYEYVIRDHLGNTRIVFRPDAGEDTPTPLTTLAYYPFGMEISGLSAGGAGYPYQYNGKELNVGVGWYAYGFRYYDPALGRFTGIDPIADKFAHVSVYNYAENEPIANIDLHGLQKWKATDGNIISGPYRNANAAQSAARGTAIPLTGISNRDKAATSTPPKSISSYLQLSTANSSNLSRTSWGETAGIYPTANTENPTAKELYNPKNWDEAKLEELQEARSGIEFVSTFRNDHTQKDDVDLDDPIEKVLGSFHLKENFPNVAPEISGDENVRFFFLDDRPDAKHPSIDSRYYDQSSVKTYGPFYNSGGGDADKGTIYIIFYSALKKE